MVGLLAQTVGQPGHLLAGGGQREHEYSWGEPGF
jgi:hypothetical protein